MKSHRTRLDPTAVLYSPQPTHTLLDNLLFVITNVCGLEETFIIVFVWFSFLLGFGVEIGSESVSWADLELQAILLPPLLKGSDYKNELPQGLFSLSSIYPSPRQWSIIERCRATEYSGPGAVFNPKYLSCSTLVHLQTMGL